MFKCIWQAVRNKVSQFVGLFLVFQYLQQGYRVCSASQFQLAMKHKLAYSSRQQKFNSDYTPFNQSSPSKPSLYQSGHRPQDTAFRQSYNFTPSANDLANVKRLPEETEFMRHTMNSKVARRLGAFNWEQETDKPLKADDCLRQTMSHKSSTRHTFNLQDDPSRELYLKTDSNDSTLHNHHFLSKQTINSYKSGPTLFEGGHSYKSYEKISEKIDRNKQMIERLKKTANYEGNYLRNVNHNKSPSYIDLDHQKQHESHGFKKAKPNKHEPTFLTPQVNKDLTLSRFKSTPQIEVSKSADKKPQDIPQVVSPTSNTNPKKKWHPSSIKTTPYLNDFDHGKKLGEGKFGIVSVIRDRKTGGVFALKKIPKAMIKSHMMIDQLSLEIRIQSCLNHNNILGMYGFFDDKTHLYIVLEYMDGGTLYEKLKKISKLSEHETAIIIKQMAFAIEYLHDMGIAHRDIKPQNIVISNNVYKLCDFGWAALCDERRKTYCGTFDYVAPQILEGAEYDMTVDLWCLGVMTFELLTGKAPFYHISRKQTMKRILNVENQHLVFPETMSDLAKDFIEKLVRKDPNERIKASQALQHPFLKNVNLNQ